MPLHRNTRWLLLLSIIVIMMVLQYVFENESVRVGLLAGAALCIVDTSLRSRRIEDRGLRLWVLFGLSQLTVAFLWSSFNLVRVDTYEAAVEGRVSLATNAHYWSIEAQDILPWIALAVAILFLILAVTPKNSTGLNTKNV